MKVNVKWGKEVFKDVEVDMESPPELFKMQLFSLSGVPIERQKVIGKGGMVPNDSWGKVTLKEGMTIMLMGSADKLPEPPKVDVQFLEDMPEEVYSQPIKIRTSKKCVLVWSAVALGQGIGSFKLPSMHCLSAHPSYSYCVRQ
jgi:hypothetical protein